MRNIVVTAVAVVVVLGGVLFYVFKPKCLNVPGDYASIQAAIDECGGKVVVVAAGEYNEQLRLRDGVRLTGAEGESQPVVWCDSEKGCVIDINDAAGVYVSNLAFEHRGEFEPGEEEGQNYFVGRIVDSNCVVEGCEFRNGVSTGLRIEGVGEVNVAGCRFMGNNWSGVALDYEGSSFVLTKSESTGNGRHGLLSLRCGLGRVEESDFSRNGWSGMCIINAESNLQVTSNVCEENLASGIWTSDGAITVLQSNECRGNKWHGISLANSSVSSNLFYNNCAGNGRAGIYLPDNDGHVQTVDNIVEGNGEINYSYVGRLFWGERFDELEKVAEEIRTKKPRFMNGNWQLRNFYDALYCPGTGAEGEVWQERFFERVDKWVAREPNSVTALIVKAKAYIQLGWNARGGGFAHTVTEDGWRELEEKVMVALEILDEAEKLGRSDPEIYRTRIQGGFSHNGDKEDMRKVLREGLKESNEYYPLYTMMGNYLQHKWYGTEKELESFANWAAERTKGTDGDALYAIVASVGMPNWKDAVPEEFKLYGFDYERLKKSFEEYLAKWPGADYYRNCYCFIACIYEDRETARRLFEEIGDGFDGSAWCKEETYEKYRKWASAL